MSATELAFRIVACAQLGLLALLLWRNRASNSSYHYAALLALSIACYLLAPLVMHEWRWGAAGYPIIVLAIVVPAFFWYFASAVFDDDFRPRLWVGSLLVATAVLGFAAFCSSMGLGTVCAAQPFAVPVWLAQAVKLLWIVAAFATVLKDWQADLVEARRRLRLLIIVGGGCYMVGIILTELMLGSRVTATVELLNVSILLIAVTALCMHLLGVDNTNVFVRMSKPAPQAMRASPPLSSLSLLASQVLALMEEQRAYAVDPLSIRTLADRLRTQPHQLRQVINGELGYRNFNTFINWYRIREVAQRLAQAQYRNTPLLTLALDAGFRSLAPFNRSFKEHCGTTPSDYRQQLGIGD